MKCKIILIILSVCLSSLTYSQIRQEKLSELQNPDDANFYQIQKSFNDYWEPFKVKKGKYFKNGKEEKAPGWKLYKRWEW